MLIIIVQIFEGLSLVLLGHYVFANLLISLLFAAIYPIAKLGLKGALRKKVISRTFASLSTFDRVLSIIPLFVFPLIFCAGIGTSLLTDSLVIGLESTLVIVFFLSGDRYQALIYLSVMLFSAFLIAGGVIGLVLLNLQLLAINLGLMIGIQIGMGVMLFTMAFIFLSRAKS